MPESKPYCYVHPEHIISTCTHTESDGTQLIFECPMCDKKASFSTIERVGQCFVCKGIIKLHSMYDNIPAEELFKPLAPRMHVSAQMSDKPAPRAEIVTRPLSPKAMDYIASRGIPMDVVQQFGLLEETTYHGGLYLAWQTYLGDYELRATFQTDKGAKITPRGHSKSFTLTQLLPEATTCIVCEGMFSALSYAQLFHRFDAWYVVLNSTSNATQLINELPTLTAEGITDVILALDHDQAGNDTSDDLEEVCQELGLRVHKHLPPHDGEDWNDALLRHQRFQARGSQQPASHTP